jgi:hypothetical protein
MEARRSIARQALVAGLCAYAFAALAFGAQEKVDYTGFWKANCEDPFGVQIKPLRDGTYSVSFCKPAGCSAPGAYRPNTRIENDPMYEPLSATKIKLKYPEGGHSTYVKCTKETNPSLVAP